VLAILAAATVASAAGPTAYLRAGPLETTPAACRSQGTMEVSDKALLYRDDGKARITELGELPKANHEKAVVRMVGPCANPLVVRYRAGR
jgi:hypothetical protein